MAEAQETSVSKETPLTFDYISYNQVGPTNYEFERARDETGKPISLPQIEERTILEVKTEVGPAFYKPAEGVLLKRVINKTFKDRGFPIQNPPFFVKRLLPTEKDNLVKEGYRLTTIGVLASPVATPA